MTTDVKDLNDAVQSGAMALFGEKYGDKVRVVSIGGFSKELCGGIHVSRTGDIGVFKLVSESSSSAGVRRIEAVTGMGAFGQFKDSTESLSRMASMLRVGEPALVEAVEKLLAERRDQDKQIERLKAKLAQAGADDLAAGAREINGMRVIAAKLDGVGREQLRSLADSLRNKIGSGLVVLGTAEDGKVALIAAATKDVAGTKVHAGKVVGAVAKLVGAQRRRASRHGRSGRQRPGGISGRNRKGLRYRGLNAGSSSGRNILRPPQFGLPVLPIDRAAPLNPRGVTFEFA